MNVVIRRDARVAPGESDVEIVERKGLGHPDSICDAVAEELSRSLCMLYLEQAGHVLHHNVDKALLAAGASTPRFGGGRVVEPVEVILAGRAALEIEGFTVPIQELAEETVRNWLRDHLHAFDADRGVRVSTAIRPGSSELVDLFGGPDRRVPCANDSSCGVGFAPLSEVEQVVLAIETRLNSARTRVEDPALGEDVKVMAFRRGDSIEIIVACAMIDASLNSVADYAAARDRAAQIALEAARERTALPLRIDVNAGDDLAAERIYLTVTGTSAESGDDGQAGRGNRVNGLITPCRPMTIESVAGKNPITHVGKLYNLAAGLIAERIVTELPEVSNAECRMVSAIGSPIDEPRLIEVNLVGPRVGEPEFARAIDRLVEQELRAISEYAQQLIERSLQLDRWPLRTEKGAE